MTKINWIVERKRKAQLHIGVAVLSTLLFIVITISTLIFGIVFIDSLDIPAENVWMYIVGLLVILVIYVIVLVIVSRKNRENSGNLEEINRVIRLIDELNLTAPEKQAMDAALTEFTNEQGIHKIGSAYVKFTPQFILQKYSLNSNAFNAITKVSSVAAVECHISPVGLSFSFNDNQRRALMGAMLPMVELHKKEDVINLIKTYYPSMPIFDDEINGWR